MKITFDPQKNAANIANRQLPFAWAEEFEWSSALIKEDTRRDYGEHRYQALGSIGERLFMLVFTPRRDAFHIISLRKANQREVRFYEAQI